jgi:probable rRNA maturation factor
MLAALQLKDAEVSILLTGDAQIHNLNKIYRGKDRATDVLAFAMREGDFARLAGDLLGDVIVSIPTARKQAVSRARSVMEETTMLLAHGLLHLLGWDHDTKDKDRRMRAETDRLCAAASAGVRSRGRPTGARAGASAVKAKRGSATRSRSSRGRPSRRA